ncbi:MAG: RND transporter MFP subunit [Gammaproteobacteria bacterium]|jgi:RND family efflux transporter MFP subunit|nr:RND transporter MFP subunit [Gammaproteobacteria bacterium]|tara:strand:+ start:38833 stop:39801 length:969 start_codon:yes stop_codon:yes gene_type:complete
MRNIKIFSTFLILLSISIEGLEVLEVKMLDSYYLTKQFPGKLLPVEQSKLSFEIPGKIKNIYVDVGDDVKEGQVLAKLDDREALARLNQVKASYDLSKQVFERFQDLRNQGHISLQELDKATSDLTIAKSEYEFYAVKLEQTSLMSPYDGVIQNRFLDSGTVINQGIPILEIIDSNYVEAHISMPVQYLNDMRIGNDYDFEIDGKDLKAQLSRLAPMSPGGSDSRLAIFKFNNFINPGSIAKLSLKINKISRGTWVPLRSLSQSDQGLWALYTIDENNIVVRDLVEIVYFEDQYAFVNGTIKDGDLIVLGGAAKIIPGKRIN